MGRLIIIAEAGVNHNGNISVAKKLIDVASKAKADYVKFQFYKTENLTTIKSKMADYQKKNFGKSISQYKLLKKYELKKKTNWNTKKIFKKKKN